MFIFDGETKRITMENSAVVNGVIRFSVEDLWTAFVDWSAQSDNLKYYGVPAMRVIGGDPIDATESVGNYLFFNNAGGWRGVPPSINGVSVVIDGAFYAEDATLPVMENVQGQETDLIINRSSISTVINASGSYPTAQEIADAVWNKVIQ